VIRGDGIGPDRTVSLRLPVLDHAIEKTVFNSGADNQYVSLRISILNKKQNIVSRIEVLS
jgi:hypothetical protein